MQHPILRVVAGGGEGPTDPWAPVMEGFRQGLELVGPTGPERDALVRGYRLASLLADQEPSQALRAAAQR